MLAFYIHVLHSLLLHSLTKGARTGGHQDLDSYSGSTETGDAATGTSSENPTKEGWPSCDDFGFGKLRMPCVVNSEGWRYILSRKLGQGSEGSVFKGYRERVPVANSTETSSEETDDEGPQPVAIKHTMKGAARRERDIIKHLHAKHPEGRHPNIVWLYDMVEVSQTSFLVMEIADGGDLFHFFFESRVKRSRVITREVFRGLVEGLYHLHENGIYHGDIKAENLLVSKGELKIADFGLSRVLWEGKLFKTTCGTPSYKSPELVDRIEFAFEPDVWAAGVVLYAMNNNMFPFDVDDRDEPIFSEPEWGHHSDKLLTLLKGMLHVDRHARWTSAQVRQSEYLGGEFKGKPTTGPGARWKQGVMQIFDKTVRRIPMICGH
eukprot:TRINITY_DN49274_c0_g1_i1.p1 TRINITY_DN49274_c0_g1~~TRINITY_DN49274_c0_g1_i1.p1  ORF type:complete len:378 (+),score=41.95 TRINITY_DN49274_c0_g1_i1:52-1185(+)